VAAADSNNTPDPQPEFKSTAEGPTTANINPAEAQKSANSERLDTLAEVSDSPAAVDQLRKVDYLSEMGVSCYQMKWQIFDKTVWTDESSLFDFILTDPPYGTPKSMSLRSTSYDNYVDDEEIKSMSQFARRVLKPGGWLFAFVSFRNFETFFNELRRIGFGGPEYPFVVMKDTCSIQQTRGQDYPQNGCDFGIVARAPGTRTDGFKPDLRSPYSLIPSKQKRKFSAVSNVPVSKEKLLKPGTKSPVLTEEKNVSLLSELITTFCPERGSVLDIYAGTFTTAIASMKTARSCTVVEENANTFRLAHARLRLVAEIFHGYRDMSVAKPPLKKGRTDEIENSSTMRQVDSCNGQSPPEPNDSGQVLIDEDRSDPTNVDKELNSGSGHVIQPKSLPIPEEDATCGSTGALETCKGGDMVELLVLKKVVGSATLQIPPDPKETFKTSIHNRSLCDFQNEGELLVSCYGYKMATGVGKLKYPYSYGGIEASPNTLSAISGFFAWDLNSMRRLL